jgi:Uncharacterized protein conserved in bacteria (DUF2188)
LGATPDICDARIDQSRKRVRVASLGRKWWRDPAAIVKGTGCGRHRKPSSTCAALDLERSGKTGVWRLIRRNDFGSRAAMLGRHVDRVHPDGEDRCRATFGRRDEAVAKAIGLARSDQPAKAGIDNGDGSIVEERLSGHDSSDDVQP